MIVVDFHDRISPLVRAIKAGMAPPVVNPAIAAAEKQLFQDHFAKLPHNKQGWSPQNYWGRAAKSTNAFPLVDGVRLTVSVPGINVHVTGLPQVIRPVSAKMLTIPAIPEAYGRRAGEFNNLRMAYHRVGGQLIPFALVLRGSEQHQRGKQEKLYQPTIGGKLKAVRTRVKDKSTGKWRSVTNQFDLGTVVYWLKSEVKTHAYPGVLPTVQEMRQRAVDVVRLKLEQIKLQNRK